MKDEAAVLYTTWPDAESAAAAGRLLVQERLCACVNILAPLRSVYRWDGATLEAVEVPALFKTTAEGAARLKDRIVALHPYETACVVMIPVARQGSNDAFLAWIRDCVSGIQD